MSTPNVRAEVQAYMAFGQLLDQAQQVRSMFRAAGLSVPPVLGRLLGDDDGGGEVGGDAPLAEQFDIGPMGQPSLPPGAEPTWLWIPAEAAGTASLVLGVLRSAERALQPQDILDRIRALGPKPPAPSVYNAVNRLRSDGHIENTPLGLRLKTPANAPIISDGNVWGAASMFSPFEVADFRRRLIPHILAAAPRALGLIELRDLIVDWKYQAIGQTGKDAVRADLDILRQQGLIERDENRRWSMKTDPGK